MAMKGVVAWVLGDGSRRYAVVYRGSTTFENLPSTLTKDMTGYTYNITDDFTTDSRFVEGAGKNYTAGTNVAVINTGTDDEPVMKFDAGGSFVDFSEIEREMAEGDAVNRQLLEDTVGWITHKWDDISDAKQYGAGATWSVSGNSIAINGTEPYSGVQYEIELPNDTYKFICTATITGGTYKQITVFDNDNSTMLADTGEFNGSAKKELTFTVTHGKVYLRVYASRGSAGSMTLSDVLIINHASVEESKADNSVIADVENAPTASKPYVVDDLFCKDGELRRATDPISTGEAITNTNSTKTTVAEELRRNGTKPTTLYAFHVDGNESEPGAKVTYLEDCAGYSPAYMDFSDGVFHYGSWSENEFFMPKPCMLLLDGTVDYYLSNHDYTKKSDGIKASDVADTAYAGNAMMEWGRDGKKIYYKIVPDTGDDSSYTVYISDGMVDDDFKCWPFINNNGILVPHFYTAIYNGSVISDTMRSISGQTVSNKLTGTQEREKARANNQSADRLWDIECFADWQLIEFLTILISKTTDSQKAFGKGLSDNGTEAINNGFITGVHNAKGLFFGTNSGAADTYGNAVKVFGRENPWGFQWQRLNGWCMNDGVQKIKLTKGTQDGSTATDYNDDGTDYISITNSTPTGTSGGYIKTVKATGKGVIPVGINGNSVSHYADGLWFNNSGAHLARVGGLSYAGARCGVSCAHLCTAVSASNWYSGATLSCKPLA